MLFSALGRITSEPDDLLFNSYLMEHSRLWITGAASAPSLWSPPVAYPASGTFAYSDLMLSFAPLYWAFRGLGFDVFTSAQLWLLLSALFNYVAAYLVFHRGLRFGVAGSAFGACLFAFSAARVFQHGHAQLWPQVFVLGAFAAIVRLVQLRSQGERQVSGARSEQLAIASFASCVVAQLYGSFYMAYFVLQIGLVALFWSLVLRETRRLVIETLVAHRTTLALCGAASAVALAPLIYHYAETVTVVGTRPIGMVDKYLPRLQSYFYMPDQSWLYGWMSSLDVFERLPAPWEQALGLGFVTTGMLMGAAFVKRHRAPVKIGILSAASLLLLLTKFPGDFSLYPISRALFPGFGGIRAVARIGLFLTLPAAIALAWWVDRAHGRWRTPLLIAACFCILEQGVTDSSVDKLAQQKAVAKLASAVDPGAQAFYVMAIGTEPEPWELQIRAMLASQSSGVPTLNFYSGNYPPGWRLRQNRVASRDDARRLEAALNSWIVRNALDRSRIQQIFVDPSGAIQPRMRNL